MNPYKSLEERAFWSPAVAKRNMFDINELWRPAYKIDGKSRIVTFGSCFAQHFSRALVARNFTWYDAEPAPLGLSEENAKKFNYGIFSARTGNIYTTSLLLQWTEWALGIKETPDEVWEKDGRFFDPFRPQIEPNGFASRDEVLTSRQLCIEAFGNAIRNSDTFVFTLGLTESWWNCDENYEYPMCPGAVDETFAKSSDTFINQEFTEIRANLRRAITLMRRERKGLRFLLTVSPVPLTATNSGNHVLVATMESKSRLRSVAGELARNLPRVDYFPSYEIINAPPFRGTFFESNQRSVNSNGVDFVMRSFFEGLNYDRRKKGETEIAPREAQQPRAKSKDDLVCEEEMLAAFGPVGGKKDS